LHHLINGFANAVASNDSLHPTIFDMANDLEERLELNIITLSRAVKHVYEFRLVNFHGVSPLCSRLVLSQADTTNWRMAENDGGDVVIAHLEIWLVVENSFRNQASLSNGNWCKSNLVGHISNSIDTWNICILKLINFDSIFLDNNTSILKIQWLKIWRSSKSTKDCVCLNVCSIRQVNLEHSIV
jgi:hypothetical protein